MSAEKFIPSNSSKTSLNTEDGPEAESDTNIADSIEKRMIDEDNTTDNVNVKIIKRQASEEKRSKRVCCGTIGQCVWGVVLVILSVTAFVFTPLDFLLWEKLNMRPGLPPYEWWADPPDEVKLRAYVFNVTNHERFLNGLDAKLNVEEIGPIVYLEKLQHSNVKFNENGTMTYTAKRSAIFLPEFNNIDMNATLIVPNMGVLGIASYLHNAYSIIKTGFRILADSKGSQLFVKKTIYEYLWDFREPVLDVSRTLAPGLVPVNNMGILARIYADFTDEVTVKYGQRWGHKEFFEIDRFRGNPQLPEYNPDTCPDRIFGSTEGVMYRQRLTKQDVLLYWRKTVCKLMPLYYDSAFTMNGVHVYRYNLSESVYDRIYNRTDCYDTVPSLPAGLSDASKCYYNFPMVVSYPHFYTGGLPKDHFVTGLKPDRTKHNSYVIVEPMTGTPFESVARMQSNLRIYDLSGYSQKYDKLSNLVLPLFWGEYKQEGLPKKIRYTIYFMTVILPPLTILILLIFLLTAFYLITKNINNSKLKNDKLKSLLHFKSKTAGNTLAKNTIFSYEKEVFIKRSS
ncbi:hypothetical protein K1T71_000911 [Dendrolimus kikuchii]|uniref:Uncharacterized protein n=1 Tax=Dendrolimus kikuchii TaxID=765133 RepID=A0ACC1DGJ9_9NEOP|nr:hypothetical protein K1T71_000911 [Dendrolimus kikuchii]